MDYTRLANKTSIWLGLLWLTFAALMVSASLEAPAEQGSYGSNVPGTLPLCLIASVIELVGFWALLQPWDLSFSWIRLLTVGGSLLLAFALACFLSLHAGSIAMAHLGWLLALQATWLILLIKHVVLSSKEPSPQE